MLFQSSYVLRALKSNEMIFSKSRYIHIHSICKNLVNLIAQWFDVYLKYFLIIYIVEHNFLYKYECCQLIWKLKTIKES